MLVNHSPHHHSENSQPEESSPGVVTSRCRYPVRASSLLEKARFERANILQFCPVRGLLRHGQKALYGQNPSSPQVGTETSSLRGTSKLRNIGCGGTGDSRSEPKFGMAKHAEIRLQGRVYIKSECY